MRIAFLLLLRHATAIFPRLPTCPNSSRRASTPPLAPRTAPYRTRAATAPDQGHTNDADFLGRCCWRLWWSSELHSKSNDRTIKQGLATGTHDGPCSLKAIFPGHPEAPYSNGTLRKVCHPSFDASLSDPAFASPRLPRGSLCSSSNLVRTG